MSLISLLTDFGTDDEYVGVMKGVIAGIHPDARVVDVSHAIAPQNVVHGAFVLAAAYPFFPGGTVHVAVVDPGVGGARRILAVECGLHRFLAPDNGLLERVLTKQAVTAAVAVERTEFFLTPLSRTFHGRDIFAPVAAHLAAGLALAELGPAIDPQTLVSGVVPFCRLAEDGSLAGEVVAVDHFGNLMTNIDAAAIERLARRLGGRALVVELAGRRLVGLADTYDQGPARQPVAIIGSRGLLEIAVNCASARRILDTGTGEQVRVRAGTGDGVDR